MTNVHDLYMEYLKKPATTPYKDSELGKAFCESISGLSAVLSELRSIKNRLVSVGKLDRGSVVERLKHLNSFFTDSFVHLHYWDLNVKHVDEYGQQIEMVVRRFDEIIVDLMERLIELYSWDRSYRRDSEDYEAKTKGGAA